MIPGWKIVCSKPPPQSQSNFQYILTDQLPSWKKKWMGTQDITALYSIKRRIDDFKAVYAPRPQRVWNAVKELDEFYNDVPPCTALTTHDHPDISNHRQLKSLFNSLFRLSTKKTLKHHITGLFWIPFTRFPSESDNNSESISKSWCHHGVGRDITMLGASTNNRAAQGSPWVGSCQWHWPSIA